MPKLGQKKEVLDVFGAPTGAFVVETELLSGTYRNKDVQEGRLKYRISISNEGEVFFYLYEDGKAKDLSAINVYGSSSLKIQIKDSSGNIQNFYGSVRKDENYVYDKVLMYYDSYERNVFGERKYDCEDLFIKADSLDIALTGDSGMYSLGMVDTSGVFDTYFYNRSLYDEGLSYMKSGEWIEAIAVFERMNAKEYDYYDAQTSINLCRIGFVNDENARAETLVESGDYADALNILEVLVRDYHDEYLSLNDELTIACRHKAGLYLVGDTGPAGGRIIYDSDSDYVEGDKDSRNSEMFGWRYLEFAPNYLIVVDGHPAIANEQNMKYDHEYLFCWGYTPYLHDNRLRDHYDIERQWGDTNVGYGYENTRRIVDAFGRYALVNRESEYRNFMTPYYAARLCDMLEIENNGVVFDDWFLPSEIELDLGLWVGNYVIDNCWTSSGYSTYTAVGFYTKDNGYLGARDFDLYTNLYVWPMRRFK